MAKFKDLKKEIIGGWSIEYRPEVKQWEVMRGTGHHGLYGTRAEALREVDFWIDAEKII